MSNKIQVSREPNRSKIIMIREKERLLNGLWNNLKELNTIITEREVLIRDREKLIDDCVKSNVAQSIIKSDRIELEIEKIRLAMTKTRRNTIRQILHIREAELAVIRRSLIIC